MTERRATIRDVAELAGVATSTVSLHLTGNKGVGDAVAAKVQAAIDELRFQPNLHARALRSNRSDEVVYVVGAIAKGDLAVLGVFRSREDAQDAARFHNSQILWEGKIADFSESPRPGALT